MRTQRTREEAERLFHENQGLVGFFFQKYRGLAAFADYTSDDVMQEIRLSLWQAALDYDQEKGAAFSTFAGRIILNGLRALHRSRRCPKRNAGCLVPLDAPLTPQGETLLVDLLVSAEDVEGRCCTAADFAAHRRQLPPQAQRAVDLRLMGCAQTEIARRIGCSQAQVSRYLKKAGAFARE
jgi:RNA polymerase sigma factor (sigma-70 family)